MLLLHNLNYLMVYVVSCCFCIYQDFLIYSVKFTFGLFCNFTLLHTLKQYTKLKFKNNNALIKISLIHYY